MFLRVESTHFLRQPATGPWIGDADPLAGQLERRGGAASEAAGYLFPASAEGPLPEAVGFGSDDFYVRTIERDRANAIVVKHHYSGRFYIASTLHLGVFVEGQLLGVIQWGYALQPAHAHRIVEGTGKHEYLELNRMWLDDRAPRNSESRAIAMSVRLIRRLRPSVKWLQSFADERCGLFGTVYQAAGFTYHGEHKSRFYELDGEWYHKLLVTNRKDNGPRARRIREGLDRATVHDLRQFRYMKFLQARFAIGCRHPARPFPKPEYAVRPEDELPAREREEGATPSDRSDHR